MKNYVSRYNGSEKVRVHLLLEKDIHEEIAIEAKEIGIKTNGHLINILRNYIQKKEQVCKKSNT